MNITAFAPAVSWSAHSVPSQASFRILEINVNYKNTEYNHTLEYIRQVDPDYLVLEEYTPQWQKAVVTELSKNYIYRVEAVRDDPYGIAVFSRKPILKSQIIHLAEIGWPSIDSEVAIENKTDRIVAAHLIGPVTQEGWSSQKKLLKDLASRIDSKSSTVVLGDFNMTPWSTKFQHLLEVAHLGDTRKGFGLQCSWPSERPIVVSKFFKSSARFDLMGANWLFQLPIDHCLVTNDLEVADRKIGPYVGSDHFPVLIVLNANTSGHEKNRE